MLAPSLGIAAWGLVTGVAMVKSGLSVPVAALMTVLVYAGSAQLAALPLIVAGAPLWVVLATAFCVNLRFVIYSAHWRKYFGHLPRWQRLTLDVCRGRSELRAVRAAFPRAAAGAGAVAVFLGWRDLELGELAGGIAARRRPRRSCPDGMGVGLRRRARVARRDVFAVVRGRRAGSPPALPPARQSPRSVCR